MTQAISSAGTSIKQVPAILNKIAQVMKMPAAFFASITDVLDMGGGKYDLLTEKLAELGIRNYVLDPFNRLPEHNNFVIAKLAACGADMAICSNVLNVIKEPEARRNLHKMIKRLTKGDGLVFYTVYEGDKSSKGKKTTKGWQANRPTQSYLRELRREYLGVTLCNNKLIVCEGFKA